MPAVARAAIAAAFDPADAAEPRANDALTTFKCANINVQRNSARMTGGDRAGPSISGLGTGSGPSSASDALTREKHLCVLPRSSTDVRCGKGRHARRRVLVKELVGSAGTTKLVRSILKCEMDRRLKLVWAISISRCVGT
jgi:hypothetical protein